MAQDSTIPEATSSTNYSSDPTKPILITSTLLIRPYYKSDIPSLVRAANNPLVSQYMGSQFPYPYTASDAATWVSIATSPPLLNFAVCHHPSGEYAGGIGLSAFAADDVRFTAAVFQLRDRPQLVRHDEPLGDRGPGDPGMARSMIVETPLERGEQRVALLRGHVPRAR